MNKHKKEDFEPVSHKEEGFKSVLIGGIYLHVSNGGITFSVIDEGFGPTIYIDQNQFGSIWTEQRVHTTTDALRSIGEMFIEASKEDFSEVYCEAAQEWDKMMDESDQEWDKMTNKVKVL